MADNTDKRTPRKATPMSGLGEAMFGMFAEMLNQQAERAHWDNLDVGIKYEGREITLPGEPGKMPLDKALQALARKMADEEQPFKVFEIIDAFPHDGAVAFVKAMTKLYGWASPESVMTFFGKDPPTMLSVKTGPNLEDVIQCPLGAFSLPGIEQKVSTMFDVIKGKPVFIISTTVPKKLRHILIELAEETRRIIKSDSIYRGKAIRLAVDDEGDLNLQEAPEFLDVSDTGEDAILFDDDLREQIETNVMVHIKHTAEVRKRKIPLKRTVLFEGGYGTGKSLTARVIANVAQQHHWTYILLPRVQGLKVALELATRYAPAVVFAEDIDLIGEERDEDTNDLLVTIDGVVSKQTEVMTVLTTNFVEKLNPVMIRPGRFDAIIKFRAPGAETVSKLIRHYAGDMLEHDEPVYEAATVLAGNIPATIRECVERAKLGMIGRGSSHLIDADLVTAGRTMKNHLELLNRDTKKPSVAEQLASNLRAVLSDSVTTENEDLNRLLNLQTSISKQVDVVRSQLRSMNGQGGISEALEAKLNELYQLVDTVDDRAAAIEKVVTGKN